MAVKETRSGRGKAHQFGTGAKDYFDVLFDPNRCVRAEAVMNKYLVPRALQISGNRKEPQGRHPVGRGGHVFLTGEPVGAGRMNKGYAQSGNFL